MNLLRRALLVGAVALTGSAVSAEAERIQPIGPQGKGDLMIGIVSIWNDSSTRLNFFLRNRNERWQNFSLGPDEQETYGPIDEVLIRVLTHQRPERIYRLETARRYRLFWNSQEDRWDVSSVAPR